MSWVKVHGNARGSNYGTIGDEFHEWVCRFNAQIELHLHQLFEMLTHNNFLNNE
jgi:hypothetical protein